MRMLIAYWTPKVTNTHIKYVTLIPFSHQQRLHERASYVHFLSCLRFARAVYVRAF